jgi:hypothetical protein
MDRLVEAPWTWLYFLLSLAFDLSVHQRTRGPRRVLISARADHTEFHSSGRLSHGRWPINQLEDGTETGYGKTRGLWSDNLMGF